MSWQRDSGNSCSLCLWLQELESCSPGAGVSNGIVFVTLEPWGGNPGRTAQVAEAHGLVEAEPPPGHWRKGTGKPGTSLMPG
jgi:hypothetical protein